MPGGNSFIGDLERHIGQTVTIFTTSGGQSGRGFTGVLVFVNPCFVRLITQIGSAPGCALGNCCERERERERPVNRECPDEEFNTNFIGNQNEFPGQEIGENQQEFANRQRRNPEEEMLGGQGRASCRRITLGSVVDIPVDRIASFVHNAVGSGW